MFASVMYSLNQISETDKPNGTVLLSAKFLFGLSQYKLLSLSQDEINRTKEIKRKKERETLFRNEEKEKESLVRSIPDALFVDSRIYQLEANHF